MYLTQIELNSARRQTKRFLGEPESLHAAVAALFPRSWEDVGRVLWRVDNTHRGLFLYIVSELKPDAISLVEQAGWPESAPARTAEYGTFLDSIENGQKYRFRLKANPTHTPWVQGKRGKPVPHVTERYQRQWLVDKCDVLGIECHDALVENSESLGETPAGGASENDTTGSTPFMQQGADTSFVICERGQQVFYKSASHRDGTRDNAGSHTPARSRHRIAITYAVFEGVLRVKDADKLRKALCEGIGREKAYGYGLMTLAKYDS